MKSLKVIKWLSIVIIMPWLIFMILAILKGGETFTKMGESLVSTVQEMTLKLSRKADMVKTQADEWKEKLTGIKSEEKATEEAKTKAEKAPVKKVKKTKRKPSAEGPASPKPGDDQ
jgi:FlaA1/EpsC-like NDP-sugar epimerase